MATANAYFQSMFSTLTTSMFPPGPDYEGTDIPGLTVVANTWAPMSFSYPSDLPQVTAYLADPRSVVNKIQWTAALTLLICVQTVPILHNNSHCCETYGNLQRIVTAIAARVRAPTWPGGRAPTDARAPA